MKTLIAILVFAFAAFGQSDLPDKGSLSDIVGKTKVYIVADGDAAKVIQKQINKSDVLSGVSKADDAEIFVEYRSLARNSLPPTGIQTETGQIDVCYFREKRKVIAWSGSHTGGAFKGDAANYLIKKFLKELSK